MMKRIFTLLLTAALLTTLVTGCGSSGKQETTVDLEALWTEISELDSDWGETYFVDLTEDPELLENYYPGLKDIPTKQLIVRVPMISAAVAEFVLMECETESDADKAKAILEQRAEDQANGGAWYPASMEAWEDAQVISNDRYVALLASSSHQSEAAELFNAKFNG